MRVGVNSGEAVVREIGGHGHVAYPMVGDTINTGARLEDLAPVGGVLIGAQTFERLPEGAVVEPRAGLRVKGKDAAVDAYVLHALALLGRLYGCARDGRASSTRRGDPPVGAGGGASSRRADLAVPVPGRRRRDSRRR